jgi:arylsulfatase A-like enzyme
VSNSVVETIDMFPTLFDLCDIQVPAHVQGESFAALLKDPLMPGKPAAFTWGSRRRVSVQTERYRLNMDRDLDPASFELYDHKYDPDEYINVSCNPQYGETIKMLVSYYSDHMEKYKLFHEE